MDNKPPAPFCRGCGCPLDDSNIDCPHEGKYGYCKGCCKKCDEIKTECVRCQGITWSYYRERDEDSPVEPLCAECARAQHTRYRTDEKGREIDECKKCGEVEPLSAFVPANYKELDYDDFSDSQIASICRECANGMCEMRYKDKSGRWVMSEIIDIDKERSA